MNHQVTYFRGSRTMKALYYPLTAILFLAVILARSASALTINFTYDPDATFLAAGLSAADITAMKAANTYAAKQFTDRFSDNINVNINVTATPGTNDFGS